MAGCDHWLQQCDSGAVPGAELCSQDKNRVNSENKTIFTFFHLVHCSGVAGAGAGTGVSGHILFNAGVVPYMHLLYHCCCLK